MVPFKKIYVILYQCHLQKDKQQHFFVSLVLFFFFCIFLNIGYALLLTFFIGLLKEIWDEFFGSGFCLWDIMANVLGMLTGLCLVSAYYLIMQF